MIFVKVAIFVDFLDINHDNSATKDHSLMYTTRHGCADAARRPPPDIAERAPPAWRSLIIYKDDGAATRSPEPRRRRERRRAL
ncbi:hypothetical protein EVAR_11187_1 [Eumeta japonica]|uniref:Uncharacterized protein n=1 Tax=Eumeta variegata TaxID=151549 RepID=A0A4C1U5N2_EUMVA|nr:hypothetical protein EVAR_11187_1 [Eumeta japonica]